MTDPGEKKKMKKGRERANVARKKRHWGGV